ncbi:MAG: HNH endonuclease, partial [Edaphobacter sp.]
MQSGKMRKQGLGGKRHIGHASGQSSGRVLAEPDACAGVSRQPAMQTPVLVLNASYEPINICGARRALVLVLKGVAHTEEEQGAILHAARMRVAMPSVIRLLEYRRIPHQTRALSRKNILLRDR